MSLPNPWHLTVCVQPTDLRGCKGGEELGGLLGGLGKSRSTSNVESEGISYVVHHHVRRVLACAALWQARA
jgi:hypothetical protein